MAVDLAQAVDILQAALLRQLGDEVDLIFRYGSSIKGTTHAYSDLDISYVPVHDTTHASITVLVDNVLMDLYPMSWAHLERMANFDDISCTVLIENELVYARSAAAAERFRQLPERLRELQQPAAYPAMLNKAQGIFQRLGYPYYLLRQGASRGHQLSCMQHARQILQGVLHCLMVCNQAVIDTRKRDQVLALPKLPGGFAALLDPVVNSTAPAELLAACEALMGATRQLLLAEQATIKRDDATFPQVFGPAYPELKGDLQHLMLACERRDLFNATLISLYHELMIHMAQALTGIGYSGFNTLEEYEQDLVALGFPDLLSYVVARDFDGLHHHCLVFDEHLQAFLTAHGVSLYAFASLDALQAHLA